MKYYYRHCLEAPTQAGYVYSWKKIVLMESTNNARNEICVWRVPTSHEQSDMQSANKLLERR